MFVANKLKNTEARPNIDEFREGMIESLEEVVFNFIQDKPMFQMDNFSAIYYDEYSMDTSCHKDVVSVLYLVIDQPANYKLDALKTKPNKFSDGIKLPKLYFSLEDIKQGVFDGLLHYLDSNNTLWQDSNSIFIKYTDYNEEHGINNYFIKIIPALAYYNKDDVKGLMYLINNQTQIEYPSLALDNYNSKNFVTDDMYRQTVLIFKNILLKDKNIETLPSEIIETILYNVPTQMFLNDKYDNMIKIINYVRNMSLKEIKTLDEQDYALTSKYRAMSAFYVKHIIKIIEKYLLSIK